MAKPVDQVRVFIGSDGEVSESPKGRVFFDSRTARFTDLSGVRLLRCGVDTVRQLYTGLLRPEVLALFDDKPGIVDFAGQRFHASRVGRDSGYQFKLQNADLGFVLLLKNFNCKVDAVGPHLKIEVSPHAIDSCEPGRLQAMMDEFASCALASFEANQCAVHLALDFQGWAPPVDFEARMHCKASNQRRFSGISTVEWADKSAVYARGQSYLFGSAGACQMALYNKTTQARSIDKLDYWESVWRRSDNPFDDMDSMNYDPDIPVWRLEFRYHHSVVQQFADGSSSFATGECVATSTFSGLAPHLDGLWRYGLGNFRLLSRPGVFDAFWTLVRDDVRVDVGVTSLLDDVDYRRHYKSARGFSGKNVDLVIGNMITLFARQRVGAKKAFEAIKTLPFWDVIKEHYASKEITERGLYLQIKERLEERAIRWGKAV